MVTQDISWYIIIYLPWTIIMCVKHMVKQCHNPPIMTLDYDMGGLWHCFTICFTHMMMVHGRYRMIYHDISLVTMVYEPTYITFWGHHLSDLSCHHDGAMTIETPPHPGVQIPAWPLALACWAMACNAWTSLCAWAWRLMEVSDVNDGLSIQDTLTI